jgi:glucose-6-phosphate isomerase
MELLAPQGVVIDGLTGAVSPETGRYIKRLSDLEGIFHDRAAWAEAVSMRGNPQVYEVVEYRKTGSDLFFGTTTMQPGKVGSEYYMTRGHFHQRPDMGEVYYTQNGRGILLLENRDGTSRTVDMLPGVCAFIPPGWAHRSINTGDERLVFVWVCNPQAGVDYAGIRENGMRNLVVEAEGRVAVIPNPRHRQA